MEYRHLDLPKISIVIPTYNQGQYIERTLLSIFSQDYENYELIIVDGASTDKTLAIITKYIDKIHVFVSETDDGQSDAILKGFKLASGEVMCWLNSDDVFLPGTLKFVAEQFRIRKDIDVLYGNLLLIDEADAGLGQRTTTPFPPFSLGRSIFLGGFGLYQPSSFWRSELYYKVGEIDRKLKHCMDNDLFSRFYLAKAKFKYVNKNLSGFRVHSLSKTSNMSDVAVKEIYQIRLRYSSLEDKLSGGSLIMLTVRLWRLFFLLTSFSGIKHLLGRKLGANKNIP